MTIDHTRSERQLGRIALIAILSVAIVLWSIASATLAQTPATVSTPVPAATVSTVADHPLLVLPRYDADAALDRYFEIDLASGDVFLIDRVRRDPLSTRRARLDDNLLEQIGRPLEPKPAIGEMVIAPLHDGDDSVRSAILVESSTGYVVYFDDLGRGGKLGEIRTTTGRPFGDIKAPGGRFVLLGRRASNGRTVDVILYHPATGQGRALRGIEKLPAEPTSVPVAGLPILEGTVNAVALQRAGGGTDGYVFFDDATGGLFRVGLTGQGLPSAAVEQSQNLFDVFPRDATLDANPRFVTVPILAEGQRTRHVLLIDVGSGSVAWLRDIDGTSGAPSLQALSGDLMRFLTADSEGKRTIVAVPRTGANGETAGVWLTDGLTGRVLYLSNLDQPDALSVGVVTVQR